MRIILTRFMCRKTIPWLEYLHMTEPRTICYDAITYITVSLSFYASRNIVYSVVRIPAAAWDSSLPSNVQNLLWGPPSLLFSGYRSFLPKIMWPGSEDDHSPPTNADVKNEWSYTSTPHIPSLYSQGKFTFLHFRRLTSLWILIRSNCFIPLLFIVLL
jgi:hypothetical protein